MENQAPYYAGNNRPPNYLEKVQSQLPALELLMKMGWHYLTPEEALKLRGGRRDSPLLDSILRDFLRRNARVNTVDGRSFPFTENAIETAMLEIKGFRGTGATYHHEAVYDLLSLGVNIPQTVEGSKTSHPLHYIEWEEPDKNVYHCTAEFEVERVGLGRVAIPDIVLFVNGIPLVTIECKRSSYQNRKRKPLDEAISQLADYQKKEGIPQLFLYSQLLLALTKDKALYGTTGSAREFWSAWEEEGIEGEIANILGKKFFFEERDRLLSGPFTEVREEYGALLEEGRRVYGQDIALYGLCRKERLLEVIYRFIVFDGGVKKIARYQQFFTVRQIMDRLLTVADGEKRPGGVVWHTQGSGKSLTMVMVAKALATHKQISAAKVVLVTDRIDLDDQIMGTFRACGLKPDQANAGSHLVKLLLDHRTRVVTTLIHKFSKAVSSGKLKGENWNTFVLVDEAHRSQYSERHSQMKIALKGACFIAFTGTPLAKKALKNTFATFGPLYKPPYTLQKAVADGAVRPLLYEARHVPQPVDKKAIDGWFDKLTLNLTADQKADLKRKFSTERELERAEKKVRMVAWDVGLHYERHYKPMGLKGQLVAPDKDTAILYQGFFEEFGVVSTEVLISSPDEREGEDRGKGASKREKEFWTTMMNRYGTEKAYNKSLINSFKRGEFPEIIIVVDKLLTGFDAPVNAVLYLTRKMREHTLLQAIARVNRVHEKKEWGLILDYSGVIEELDEAIDFYSLLADYDPSDLEETVTLVSEKVAELPRLHGELWEIFNEVRHSVDPESYEIFLREEKRRDLFYRRFGLFARTLSLALASTTFLEETPLKTVDTYKKDLKFFQNLRVSVLNRYQESVRYSEYEPRIKALIDAHVGAEEVKELCPPIDLLDTGQRNALLADQGKSLSSKADTIAAAASHTIEKEMAKDPVFYKKFSKMLEETLEAYYEGRLKELEALEKLTDIATKVATHTDDDIPDELLGHDMARRYFGTVRESLPPYGSKREKAGAEIALKIVERIGKHKIRDWKNNHDALNRMRQEIDEVIFEISDEQGVSISLDEQNALIDRCIEVALANES